MKGFSLLECLVATTFFLAILLAGYEALDSQSFLISHMLQRTRPEEESNYRLLLLEILFRNVSETLKQDPMLERVPYFFPDLRFGQEPAGNAFSIAHPIGMPVRFQREGNLFSVPSVPLMKAKKLVALGGGTQEGRFEWNYGTIRTVDSTANAQQLTVDFLLAKTAIDYGCLIEVEIEGLLFRKDTLYWITPAGQAAPYFAPLRDFRYEWRSPELTIHWKTGLVEAHCKMTL